MVAIKKKQEREYDSFARQIKMSCSLALGTDLDGRTSVSFGCHKVMVQIGLGGQGTHSIGDNTLVEGMHGICMRII